MRHGQRQQQESDRGTKKPTTQCEALLAYMKKGNEVDFQVAAQVLGISQLTGRIAELRKKGYRFSKREEKGKNRYGNHFTKVYYFNPRKAI